MNVAKELFRFAELAARTGLEPELGARFDSDPVAVLMEFELPVEKLGWAGEDTLFIDDLSGSADAFDLGASAERCFCQSARLDTGSSLDAGARPELRVAA